MSENDFQSIFDSDEDGLLDTSEKAPKLTSSDRLGRSFLEIIEFYREHERLPRSDTHEIAERKLGARLDGILANEEKIDELRHLDEFGLLTGRSAPATIDELLSDDDLGLLEDASGILDTSGLPARAPRVQPDEVAQRTKAEDFHLFESLFTQKHADLGSGRSKLIPFAGEATLVPGSFFVMSGVMLLVAEVGEEVAVPGVRTRYKRRTRTIFENGTESGLFRRSLAGQLYEHEGFAVVDADYAQVFPDDVETGFVYVLRSLSDDPRISAIDDLYKIGFSRGSVEKRIAHAELDATYLFAPVDVVATYRTYNVKTSALEHLLHRVFEKVRLDVSIGRAGRPFEPAEWYSVPLPVIDEAVDLIMSGDIVDFEFDVDRRVLVPRSD